MLYRMEKLIGMSIGAADGEIGKIKDVYFDDRRWAARYLVVDTGGWLENRKVLISPFSVAGIDWDLRVVNVKLTRERVEKSPSIDSDKPVSRQHEVDFLGYYGFPGYWGGPLLWGEIPYPVVPEAIGLLPVNQATLEHPEAPLDGHLRSAAEVSGYHIHAVDDSFGHLQDFMIDSENWAIRYIVVDTRNWWPGKHVVIPPQWIKRLDWAERIVHVAVERDTVQNAPQYDPTLEFSRLHEEELYQHYRQRGYWQ